MAFLVCLLFRESIGVAITKSFVIFVRKFFVSSIQHSYLDLKQNRWEMAVYNLESLIYTVHSVRSDAAIALESTTLTALLRR